MAVRRSRARLVSSRAGAFAGLALCWCWRRWLAVPGLCMAGGAGGPLPALRMGGRVCLARWRWCWRCSSAGGSGLRRAGMLAAGQLSQQAHTTHAATAGPGSGEGLPIMPPRPGSAIAGRPAENGHGPPPRVFTAPGLVSW